MRMHSDEVVRLRLRLGDPYPEWVEACITSDNIWCLSEDDMPDPNRRRLLTQMVQMRVAGAPRPLRYLPSRHLRWAVPAVELYPGSEILDWRGRNASPRRTSNQHRVVFH